MAVSLSAHAHWKWPKGFTVHSANLISTPNLTIGKNSGRVRTGQGELNFGLHILPRSTPVAVSAHV